MRTPGIPGVNASRAVVRAPGEHLKDMQNMRWELLLYHAYGSAKYAGLGRRCRKYAVPDGECMKESEETARHSARVVSAKEHAGSCQ